MEWQRSPRSVRGQELTIELIPDLKLIQGLPNTLPGTSGFQDRLRLTGLGVIETQPEDVLRSVGENLERFEIRGPNGRGIWLITASCRVVVDQSSGLVRMIGRIVLSCAANTDPRRVFCYGLNVGKEVVGQGVWMAVERSDTFNGLPK
ncbi:hypothetical protein MPH_01283 [Macrophomina phaseolina MS6]|uniref:Uncharacterized protein n=1 Tax=Macrophomina phaseolina (strain MS6) TaxID=1126212 RepID=K2RFI9_MACPH|nr:hypothetical protein MPH_01283 [Macrophomina phaseolina MS6]